MRFKLIFIALIAFSSCEAIKEWQSGKENQTAESGRPLARVHDMYLYEKDISGLMSSRSQLSDSAHIAARYVDTWVKKQLLISRASEQIKFNQADIDRKVLDYRYSLIIHDFEKLYINQNLNKEINDKEVESYYHERSDNFVLRQNIVRCLFAKIPKGAPQINAFRKQIRTYPSSDIEEIKSYCYRFASKSSLDVSLWLNFDEVIANTPFASIQDRVSFLKNNKFIENSDDSFYYYVRILAYMVSNEISPLAFVRDDIESILVNKRKVQLKKALEDEVLTEAREKNEFEIY